MIFGRYPVSDDLQGWIEENFRWAMAQGLLTSGTRLILPTAENFTAKKGEPEVVAQGVFDDLRRHLGLEQGDIALIPLNVQSAEHRIDYNALSAVGGTWQGDDGGAVVHYDPQMVHTPMALISLLAHELMHHVLHGIEEYPPGGPEAEELATDLHVITMGLGVMELAGAEAVGWQGYMSQPARAHALALFLAVREIPEGDALEYLPSRAGKYLRRAMREVDKAHDLDDLRAALS